MKKCVLALMMVCCGSFLHGNDLEAQIAQEFKKWQIMEDFHAHLKATNQLWTFNDQEYVLNEQDQWEPFAYQAPNNIHEYLVDLAKRGVCPKEHQGIYLDTSIHPEGLWYCRGLYNKELCPFHIDVQCPNGIPSKK